MITLIELLISLPIILLTTLLAIELILGVVYYQDRESDYTFPSLDTPTTKIRSAILIPAHNEEDAIGHTLTHLKSVISQNDQIVVVADNCSDMTSAICNSHGVKVLERFDSQNKGKGFALEYGRQWILDNLDVDVVILFDADCVFIGDSLPRLIQHSFLSKSVFQACYLMKSKPGSVKTIVPQFTWWIRNAIRSLGLNKLNVGCQIQGSGIAFPFSIIQNLNFSTGSIVEDMELGLRLSLTGQPVQYRDDCLIESYFPENQKGLDAQRSRWEHGHLAIISTIPKLLIDAIRSFDFKSVLLLLDVAIPPLISFMLIKTMLLIVGLCLLFVLGHTTLFYVMLSSLLVTTSALLAVWLVHGRKLLGISSLYLVANFFLSKISIYSRFFGGKRAGWDKTTRDKK
ncbi:glycosyltransferase [Alteromonas stellipolaris]|uniref:glycosyltransferase family 2 protein n=1 Tax=Alteromonas stellipolaris TaxID=233316 RepID=UPI0021181EF5|nr:glycosyltransferase family 2 protein [Alteromonas stellipolaris]MCQ8847330.1 glycosyltransferase [Alteromonas stellipolaris]